MPSNGQVERFEPVGDRFARLDPSSRARRLGAARDQRSTRCAAIRSPRAPPRRVQVVATPGTTSTAQVRRTVLQAGPDPPDLALTTGAELHSSTPVPRRVGDPGRSQQHYPGNEIDPYQKRDQQGERSEEGVSPD